MTVSERGFRAPSRSMAWSMRAISKSVADGEPAPDPSQEGNWRTALVFSLLPMNLLLSRPSGTLSPSEGERDGVRGRWVGSRSQGAHKVRGVLSPEGAGGGLGPFH